MSKEDTPKPLELNKLIWLQNQADKLIKRIRAEPSEKLRTFYHDQLKVICKEMGEDVPELDEIIQGDSAPEESAGKTNTKPKFSNPPIVDEFWRVFFQLQKQGVPVDISNDPSIIAFHWKTLIRLADEQGIELPLSYNKKALRQSVSPEFMKASVTTRIAPGFGHIYKEQSYRCWRFKKPDRTY